MKFAFFRLAFSTLRFIMPVTRSATRSIASTPVGRSNNTTTALSPSAHEKTPRTKKTKSSYESAVAPLMSDAFIPPPPPPLPQNESEERTLVPAVLTFSFEEAKAHLIRADHRFEDIFTKLKCKPFEFLEQAHPFRALVESILGQQISWLAARSIIHRFTRLYNPSLPEKAADYSASKSPTSFFPTPYQVANTDIVTLKSAGLSTRKAEYVKDLAARFADERLSTEKLLAADDESLAEMLIEVRGIGRVFDMFAIFSLRRPNILPVGDLGVQRGMLRWFLSRHSSKHAYTLSPHKLSGGETNDDKTKQASSSAMGPPPTTPAPNITLGSQRPRDVEPDNGVLPTPSESQSQTPALIKSIPEPFTPSINKTLEADAMNTEPLPEGLSVANLKTRLEGKKIKGAFLTPKEMEDLSASWAPFRSLGVYYMWALSEEKN
ncbi:DNA glycosylase [Suillus occidentalis]|nr:DNA glycosylase [Suillus occidentalis]